VSGTAKSIDALYFDYKPVAGHMEDCRFHGTDLWEVSRHTEYVPSWSERRPEVTLRLACHACGVVHFQTSDAEGSFETTNAGQVGYAGKPERVGGVWLHAGPRMWYGEERGPACFYVTTSKDRPRQPSDVLGMVGWGLGHRGGVRWSAGVGCTGHGTVEISSGDQTWTSRRGAVAWVVDPAAGAQ
jgi:hypothetical protein